MALNITNFITSCQNSSQCPEAVIRQTARWRSRSFTMSFDSKRTMYNLIIQGLNDMNICTGYTFVATPRHCDNTKSMIGDWFELEVPIDCEQFVESGDPWSSDCVPRDETRQAVLDKILSYPQLLCHHQHRVFQFMALFIEDHAHLVFFDPVFTYFFRNFQNTTNSAPPHEFSWRVAAESQQERT
ncbi:hypothetical protein BD413DRAFT_267167 [Trametes elegans]|nr:hypothetical protein BD413DRAFT_267167 [Trametes elegans]